MNEAEREAVARDILRLKRDRRAVILAHNYQRPEVQDIADYVGDSLGLSRQAAATDRPVIVFCGVHFMAETAATLCPDRIVLLPDLKAGCPMADMITADQLREEKAAHPGAAVVAYVNTTAEVKALSDVCCTSANAVRVLRSIEPGREIIFVPDKNLAAYASAQAGRPVIPWPGFCPTHHHWITQEAVARARREHPEALVVVHPECNPEVVAMADHVASTTGMVRYARESPARQFIIGTEEGLLHQLRKACPDKAFYPAAPHPGMICPNMKTITLRKVRHALETLQPQVTVPEPVRTRALAAIQRMLELGS
ncbi:MAG: quinolinate synthase NadA [Thermaerobacter sp.]|nr:quinolinate synthase NadA [Thermaerobacter sp.]